MLFIYVVNNIYVIQNVTFFIYIVLLFLHYFMAY